MIKYCIFVVGINDHLLILAICCFLSFGDNSDYWCYYLRKDKNFPLFMMRICERNGSVSICYIIIWVFKIVHFEAV